MASESTSKADLTSIPSNVSGDGKNFVSALKNFLKKYMNDTDGAIEEAVESIGEGAVSQATGLTLTEEHVTNSNGNVNNIRVQFDTTNVSDYAFAQIWCRSVVTGGDLTAQSWSQLGKTSSVQYLIEGVTTGYTYQIKVVACNNNAGYAEFSKAPTASIDIKGSVLICNSPTQFYWDNTDKKWYWTGYVDNGYTDFFELRTDQNAGVWSEHRLDSIPTSQYIEGKGYYSTAEPPSRSGTAYLYVRNVFGQYNTPISHQYAVTAPQKPATPSLKATLDGVVITFETLPTGCSNYVVDVDGSEFEVFTSQWTYFQFSGSITVKYCFVDSIGRSEWSESAALDVGRQITVTDISDGAISTPKLAANAVTADKINANAVTAAKIASNAVTADKINAGAVTANKIAADAIQIGGDNNNVTIQDGAINGSKITAASIYGDQIAANTIEANHLKAETITLSGDLSVVGGVVTFNSEGLTGIVKDGNGVATGAKILFNNEGLVFKDANGNVFSQLARFRADQCNDGDYITLNWDVAPQTVLLSPVSVMTMIQGYTTTNLLIKCFPSNISKEGFKVNIYTALGTGSESTVNWTGTTASFKALDWSGQPTPDLQVDYTDYITVENLLTGETGFLFKTQVAFTNALTFYADRPHTEHYIYIEIVINGETVINKLIGSAIESDVNGKTYTYGYNNYLQFASGSTIKFRFRCEHRDWDGLWARETMTVPDGSATAVVESDTKVESGSGNYLALG